MVQISSDWANLKYALYGITLFAAVTIIVEQVLVVFWLQFVKDAFELVGRGINDITAAIATLFNYFFKVLERKTTILSSKNTSK